MKIRIIGAIGVAVMVSAMLPAAAIAAPQVFIYTDKGSYQAGDTIEVSLAAENHGDGIGVDVYVGLLTPEGSLYTLGELAWSEAIGPWVQDIYLPSQFNMERSPFFWFPLPCEMPPIWEAGEYSFASVLTAAGTMDWISEAAFALFDMQAQAGSHFYVDASGSYGDGSKESPWKTITYALDKVDSSVTCPVTVHVAKGIYSSRANGETFPLCMKSWVRLVGEASASTILDAEAGAAHVIYCDWVTGATIEGFTIFRGAALGPGLIDVLGAGIFCSRSSVEIRGNIISGNWAKYFGGAIACLGSSPTIVGNTISGNCTVGGGSTRGTGGGIHCDENSSPTISDNTISRNSAADYGGGIYCSGSLPTISNNAISGNSASVGGGIYCGGGSPTIRHNTITGNSASSGGGIYCGGDWPTIGSPTISDNIISTNSAWGSRGGGGIYCYDGYPTIENNTIEGNSANNGGGVSCDHGYAVISGNTIRSNSASSGVTGGGGVYSYGGSILIRGNSITDNSAADGGGIFCWCGNALVQNNTIEENWARTGGGLCWYSTYMTVTNNHIIENSSQYGGGICCDFADVISNNTIALNAAEGDGGGIYCDFSIVFNNNTISGNVAGGLGGGIYAYDKAAKIIDSIIWDNGDDLHNWTAAFCCVQDPDEGEGNIHDDPMFMPGPYGEYYLHPDSPCIDAGSRSAEDAGLSEMTTQTDGTPDTGTVDMGCHYPIP